ncbi:hypothetical protein OG985_25645 [Streptomyces sp. NBC_00289]|uniref:hypothetical protein n=1 Tax=Streptomyces sp. NBC_00289 TaxID=2975703 RepID=UPI00324FC233
MTQSGQGEEPSARPAREGIVLPSDGGEPLLPGMTGGYTGAYGGRQDSPQGGQQDSRQSSGQYGGQQDGRQDSGQYGGQQAGPYGGHGAVPQGGQQSGQYGEGAAAPQGGQQPPAVAPTGGQAWGTPWGPEQQQAPAQPPGQGWSAPPAQAAQQPTHAAQPAPWGAPEASGSIPSQPSQPLPPEGTQTPQSYGPAGGFGPPATGGYANEGATQYLPPVQAGPAPASLAEGATQYLPPVVAPANEGATQYLPPVGPGALPPEMPAESAAESTHFLGRAPQGGRGGAGPLPAAGPLPPAGHPDAEATQFIAPVPGQPAGASYGAGPGGEQDRQPPAEFDNLFRGGPGGDGPAGATQQMPRFAQPDAQRPAPAAYSAQPAYTPPGPGGGRHGGYDDGDDGGRGGRGGRRGSRVPVIAAVGIGIVVLGIGAGALLAGGGGDDRSDDKNQPVSATAPTTEGSSSPSADPAEQQATALDKLLADSGDSRASVISAVADVRACDNLGQAAKDLRAAAAQRGQLVTRLSGLTVDKLPSHAELTTALTKAWQASASADQHYAAWADQVAGKKGCKKGQARTTGQTVAGNRASGTASTEKARASQLWNAIAKPYGLTQRTPTQL